MKLYYILDHIQELDFGLPVYHAFEIKIWFKLFLYLNLQSLKTILNKILNSLFSLLYERRDKFKNKKILLGYLYDNSFIFIHTFRVFIDKM